MRDGHRLRERIELTLDDRQVAALAVGALVLLAGVFALGLLVGKQLARNAPQPGQIGDLAALDAQREQAQRTPPAKPLPTPAAKAAPAPAVAKAAAEVPDEQVPESGKPPPEAPKPKAEAKPKEIPPPPGPVSVTPAKAVTVKPAQPAALPGPPADWGKFTVQLGASQERADALALAARAGAAGLKPYVVEARIPGKGIWYRVRVGAFPDRDAADRYRRDVEREMRTAAAVMPAR